MMTDFVMTSASGRFARAALGLAFAIGAGSAALAQSSIDVNAARSGQSETTTRLISVSDINVATADGQRKLETRLRIAAGAVCGKFSTPGVRVPADYVRCYERALSGARAQIGTRTAMADGAIRVSTN